MYTEITSNKRKSIALVLIFFLFIVALGYLATLYFESGPALILFVVVVATIMSLVSYFQGDKIALGVARAHPIAKEDSPYVYRMVENLSIATGIPLPKIYIIQNPALNAFATGRDPEHASVALTTGIIEGLENEELEGVIAHELSHVGNRDILLSTVVVVIAGLISMLSDVFLRIGMFGGHRDRDDREGGNPLMIIAIVY
ncbi:MAG: M48 family metalloprotease, partial [Patescibacteria group bacterium]